MKKIELIDIKTQSLKDIFDKEQISKIKKQVSRLNRFKTGKRNTACDYILVSSSKVEFYDRNCCCQTRYGNENGLAFTLSFSQDMVA
jgi:hypothetical protein